MDSRPIGAGDNAFAYTFARDPRFEATLRVALKTSGEVFEAWQTFYSHPPIVTLGEPTVAIADMPWTGAIPHVGDVNPYF